MPLRHPMPLRRPMPLHRKAGYAFGDYGCNLYWQSISFFLLFFYTDVLGLSVAAAGLIYMAASIFDGCIDPAAGALMDRTRLRWGRYRPWLLIGALPLAASFAFLYWRPPLAGTPLVAAVLAVHLLFRICYTSVAVPLASLSAQLTSESRERTTLAALRMVFGGAATATVGFATQPLAAAFAGGDRAAGFFPVAILFAALATVALVVSFGSTREAPEPDAAPRRAPTNYATGVRRNAAFLMLALGLLFATLSTTALNKSLIYYFKYVVGSEGDARIALSSSAFVALAMAPAWAMLGRRAGKRVMWLAAVASGLAGLAGFALFRPTTTAGATAFFIWMQVATVGVQVSYWGMLPDTVEFGEWRTGQRHESFLFGLFMFVQKAGFGLAVALYGMCLSAVGFEANSVMPASVLSSIGWVMAGLSAIGLAGSGLAAFLSPLRRGVHERIVDALATAVRDEGSAASAPRGRPA